MSPVTPATLPRHELVGLSVSVADADNPDLVGLAGEVVTETTKTLGVRRAETGSSSGGDRVAHVPKEGTTFEFDLPRGARSAPDASGERSEPRAEVVTVEGRRLVSRSARRTENTGDSKWR